MLVLTYMALVQPFNAKEFFKFSHLAISYQLCETSPSCIIPESKLKSDTYMKDRNQEWGVG